MMSGYETPKTRLDIDYDKIKMKYDRPLYYSLLRLRRAFILFIKEVLKAMRIIKDGE